MKDQTPADEKSGMNNHEAEQVAHVVRHAHCVGCVRSLCKDLEERLPQFNWYALVAKLNPEWWTEKWLRTYED